MYIMHRCDSYEKYQLHIDNNNISPIQTQITYGIDNMHANAKFAVTKTNQTESYKTLTIKITSSICSTVQRVIYDIYGH